MASWEEIASSHESASRWTEWSSWRLTTLLLAHRRILYTDYSSHRRGYVTIKSCGQRGASSPAVGSMSAVGNVQDFSHVGHSGSIIRTPQGSPFLPELLYNPCNNIINQTQTLTQNTISPTTLCTTTIADLGTTNVGIIDPAYTGHEAMLQTAVTLQNLQTTVNGDQIVNNRVYGTLQNKPVGRRSFDNRSLDCKTLGARSPGCRSIQRPLDPRNLDSQFIDTRTMDSRIIDSREEDRIAATQCLIVDPNHQHHRLSHHDLRQVTTPHINETMVPLTELPSCKGSLTSLGYQPNGSARPYGMPPSGSCNRLSRVSSQEQDSRCCSSCGCCKVFVSLMLCLAIFGSVVVSLYFFIRCGFINNAVGLTFTYEKTQ